MILDGLTILGSTGSIGQSTLDVARHLGIRIHALTAHRSVAVLADQIAAFTPQLVVVADDAAVKDLTSRLGEYRPEILTGPEGLCQAASDAGSAAVVTAIVGAAGLRPTLAAIDAGKRVGIANKEPLVMAGELILARAAASGAVLLPIDSEHSAIFQCLEGHATGEIDRLILTASGGPFRTRASLADITVEEALKHPNWDMGPKITIDSATLMNKALEVIEARWLFDVPVDQIEVLVHPQSVVHSMVAYNDGSLMAQLGQPDMRTPIQYALTWPRHVAGPVPIPDLSAGSGLTFEAPREDLFPSLALGRRAAAMGGIAPCVLNAANEVAVAAFLDRRIPFTAIFAAVEKALDSVDQIAHPDLDTIIAADAAIRASDLVA